MVGEGQGVGREMVWGREMGWGWRWVWRGRWVRGGRRKISTLRGSGMFSKVLWPDIGKRVIHWSRGWGRVHLPPPHKKKSGK